MPVRSYDQNQQFLLPPSLNEWVSKDNPARVFSDIIDRLDVSGFQEVKTEGRPRYNTRMMLKILLWCYANGIRSSRKIEERLHADVVFMWLAGLEKPDFRTLCLFRRTNIERINYLFCEVILLANGLGLLKLGLIALDGSKVRANVSVASFKTVRDWQEELNKAQEEVTKILSEAEGIDRFEDTKYGKEYRGDEIPKGLEEAEERVKKIEGLLGQIKGAKKDENRRLSGSEPDAKFMHHKNGSIPAYNGEVAVTTDQIIVYSDVTNEPVDTNQLVPALDGIKEVCRQEPKRLLTDAGFNSGSNFRELESRRIDGYIPEGREENIGKDMRSDRGLYSKDDFQYDPEEDNYTCPAGEVLKVRRQRHIRTKYREKWITLYETGEGICEKCSQRARCTRSNRRRVMRGEFEAEQVRMRQKLKTEEGKAIYKKRKTIVEPVIGQIKTVGGFIRFLLRGLIGAKIEWKWATIAHNILKLTRKVIGGDVKLSPVFA